MIGTQQGTDHASAQIGGKGERRQATAPRALEDISTEEAASEGAGTEFEPQQLSTLPLRIVRLDKDLPLPRRAHPTDAGIDLYSTRDVEIQPGERILVGTGIAIGLNPGTVGLIHPRSGLALKHGLSIVNTPGTIDEDYRGEIKVCLINVDRHTPISIQRGDRIAQLVLQKVLLSPVEEVKDVEDLGATVRGAGGYGSTGH